MYIIYIYNIYIYIYTPRSQLANAEDFERVLLSTFSWRKACRVLSWRKACRVQMVPPTLLFASPLLGSEGSVEAFGSITKNEMAIV